MCALDQLCPACVAIDPQWGGSAGAASNTGGGGRLSSGSDNGSEGGRGCECDCG